VQQSAEATLAADIDNKTIAAARHLPNAPPIIVFVALSLLPSSFSPAGHRWILPINGKTQDDRVHEYGSSSKD
jgi:hypothetical protein